MPRIIRIYRKSAQLRSVKLTDQAHVVILAQRYGPEARLSSANTGIGHEKAVYFQLFSPVRG